MAERHGLGQAHLIIQPCLPHFKLPILHIHTLAHQHPLVSQRRCPPGRAQPPAARPGPRLLLPAAASAPRGLTTARSNAPAAAALAAGGGLQGRPSRGRGPHQCTRARGLAFVSFSWIGSGRRAGL